MDLSKLRYQNDFHVVNAIPLAHSPEWFVEILHESGSYARVKGKPANQTVPTIVELEKLIDGLEKKWRLHKLRWNITPRRGSKIDWIKADKFKPDIVDMTYLVYFEANDIIEFGRWDEKWGWLVGNMPLSNAKALTHWAYMPDRPR